MKLIKRLQVYKLLTSDNRISSLDVFRAIAIILVVFYHFNMMIFGKIGVDLFFVISGFLVGGILLREFDKNEGIHVSKFILQRGFKIWPSYYFFLLFGSLLAHIFYGHSHTDQIIRFHDYSRYLLFYMNYDTLPEHFSFDHLWSLCVEEHFYILLPVSLFLIQKFGSVQHRKRNLYMLIFSAIIMGFLFKIYSMYFTHGRDTYLATHNRIDALAWGILLYVVIDKYGHRLRQIKWLYLVTVAAFVLIAIATYINFHTHSFKYHKLIYHSVLPPLFFLMIIGVYFRDFHKMYFLRGIGYFSYNWYLWHPIFVYLVSDMVGSGITGFIIYLLISLSMAVIATILIEEPILKRRKAVIYKIFKKQPALDVPKRVLTQ